jgi:hypothetical protein
MMLWGSDVRQTIGYHVVVCGHGLWLPGDGRGSWSDAWDEQIGFVEPHTLHASDPVRQRMAAERMVHLPVRLTPAMVDAIGETVGRCVRESDWTVHAASIEPTHVHLLLTYTPRDIDNTVKWLKDRTTKAVHKTTAHQGPVWCKENGARSYSRKMHGGRLLATSNITTSGVVSVRDRIPF